ncbi:MAG: sensor histidine kinase [Paracoccaceae bacterium]
MAPLATWLMPLTRLRVQFVVILTAAMLPAGVLAIGQALFAIEQQRVEQAREVWAQAQLQAGPERDTFLLIRVGLRAAAEMVEQNESGDIGDRCREVSLWLRRTHWAITDGILIGSNGRVECVETADEAGASEADWAAFREAQRFMIGEPRVDAASGRIGALFYHPIRSDESGIAAIAARVDIDRIHDFVRGLDSAAPEMPFALVEADGSILAMRRLEDRPSMPSEPRSLLTPGGTAKVDRANDGEDRVFASLPMIPGQLWWIGAAPSRDLADFVFSWQVLPLVSPLLLWLIAVAVIVFSVDRLVGQHVRRLQRTADRIGRGELDIRINRASNAPFEIRRLGDAITAMAGNLADREARLREALATQRSLLLEVHHRVKNNLQMISSLINIQLRRIDNPRERTALHLLQDRIHSLALVHQSLYATERLDHVALDQLVRELAEHLNRSFGQAKESTELAFRLEPVTVDAEVATPTALFITEAMANVFKHASSCSEGQRIEIALCIEDGWFTISITNCLCPNQQADSEPARGSGLGLRLMEGFARQLGGRFERTKTERRFCVRLSAPIWTDKTAFDPAAPPPSGTRSPEPALTE